MKQIKDKSCCVCGASFKPRFRATERMCSFDCHKKYEEANTKQRFCNVCKKSFIPYKSTIKSCSFECTKKHEESKPKKKVKLIAPVSKKLASRLQVYRIRRDAFMKQHTMCQCTGCGTPSQDLHHMSGRLGNNLIDESTFMAVCRKCHIWIHENPKQARALKYLQ